MTPRVVLSFWDLCLDNLPEGRFERRTVLTDEARAMIRAAQAEGAFLAVSNDDLLAPYHARQQRRHQELCALLRKAYDIPLRFEDFLSAISDQDGTSHHTTPLQAVCLQPGDRMLIVSCGYSLSDAGASGDPNDRFTIAPDSVHFDLIVALPAQGEAAS